ncbi:hypothetical protein BOTBODRAFT_36676 [Botryobasidium botryosum FD-172 SS1]|uniref:mRNA-capping enzyme subunit beta n=1 Tax=Botryobasidium botryosum (strain FD-172 SS1) TaxID=930990 RepID=A0A067ME71_BOTB1|nr:hypothetical protein BOTBODRAFT_36676 [Botryobasidium botryosum FD-172 SS1]
MSHAHVQAGPSSTAAHPFNEATYYDDYSGDEDNAGAANSEPEGSDIVDSDESDDFLPPRPAPPPAVEPTNKKRKLSPREDPNRLRQNEPLPEPQILEPSIINAEPLDEFMREVADWILQHTRGRQNIEIEAKVGLLIDTRTRARLHIPVQVETIIAPDYPSVRFEADMSAAQHAHINQLLNNLHANTMKPGYPHARITYAHTRQLDSFYPMPGGDGSNVRVTTDEKTGEVKACVNKIRVAHLNVYSPKRRVDWRISISAEMPAPRPSGPPTHTRRKDRITYTHQAFQVDLTQVKPSQANSSQPPSVLHELELEFRDPHELLRAAAMRENDSTFDELVRVFINNTRILVRNA